ncbi:MAG: thioesterase family protein [bacterium]
MQVEALGRSVAQLSARMTGTDGAVVATALATFAVSRPGTTSLDADPPPEAPPWPAGVDLGGSPFTPTFVRHHFDLRFSLGEPLFSGAARAETGGRVRFQRPPPDDAASIVALLDAWPPGVFPLLKGPAVASSVDLTCHFFRPLPDPAVDVAGAFQFLKRCEQIGDGYAEERGTLWTEGGLPVARVRQLYAFFA